AARAAEELLPPAEDLALGPLSAWLLALVRGALVIQVREQPKRETLLIHRLLVREQGHEQLVALLHRLLLVAMPETLAHLLSGNEDGPHDRAARAGFIKPHPVTPLADGFRPAPPRVPAHRFLRSWAMPWASAVASYDPGVAAASFRRSRRCRRMRPFGLARRSGRRPPRTARRIVSSHTPVSRAASPVSSSTSSHARAALTSFVRSAVRAAAPCAAPFWRRASVSWVASWTKRSSHGGRPWGTLRGGEVAESGSFALKRLNWVAGWRVAGIRLPSGGTGGMQVPLQGIGSDEAERARLSVPVGGGVAERGGEGLFALPLSARQGADGPNWGSIGPAHQRVHPYPPH